MELETEPLVINEDLTGIATTIPNLPASVYDLRITGITKEQNKDKTGHNGVMLLETTVPAMSTDGREIAPGHKLRMYFPLQNKPDAKPDFDWRRRLAEIQLAALGEKKVGFNANELIGRVMRVTVKLDPADSQYGERNSIGTLSQVK